MLAHFIHFPIHRQNSSGVQVIVNATSTLLPSVGTLSEFKLSIQAPKTFVVTPTAFSGTVSTPFARLDLNQKTAFSQNYFWSEAKL